MVNSNAQKTNMKQRKRLGHFYLDTIGNFETLQPVRCKYAKNFKY